MNENSNPWKKTDIEYLIEYGIAEKMARRRRENIWESDPQNFGFPLENRISNFKIVKFSPTAGQISTQIMSFQRVHTGRREQKPLRVEWSQIMEVRNRRFLS